MHESALPAKLRVVIVDDEPLARRGLRLRLAQEADVEIVGECAHGAAALELLRTLDCDLLLLDVQMPGMDGFETLQALPAERRPLVVFVTAFDQHAIRAFEAAALDYLLKPVDPARLATCLARVRETRRNQQADRQQESLLALLREVSGKPGLRLEDALDPLAAGLTGNEVLSIRDGQRTVRVPMARIRWIEAAGDYMCVNTDDDTYVLRTTLGELEAQLDPRRFQRVHRSRIVNLTRVRAMRPHMNGEYFLELDSGHSVKLSRSYRDKIELLR
jgi:two-component system LytT family response regulator